MCGIAGYIGNRNAPEILFDMLKRLEYRGYDSAGISIVTQNGISILKDKGMVDEVRKKTKPHKIRAKIGIAHTRWATHGEPSLGNSHPHVDCTGKFSVTHNGIIENYKDLRSELIGMGHTFKSETDTEVIPHLIAEFYSNSNNFEDAFVLAMKKLKGSFAIAAISHADTDRIIIARKDSPLIVGIGDGENFIASDTPAILPETREIIILNDFDYAIVSKDSVTVKDIRTGEELKNEIQTVEWDIKQAEKEGFDHFMLKEIYEEPDAVRNAIKGSGGIKNIAKKLKKFNRIYFVACGTASYAGLVGKYVLERFGIHSEMVVGSEFRYSTINTIDECCAIIAVSQSGETADTIASVKAAKEKGAYIVSVVNAVGSSLTRLSNDNVYIYAGPEIAVASTKAYIGQVVCLTLLGIFMAENQQKIDSDYAAELLHDLNRIPDMISEVLGREEEIRNLTKKISKSSVFFYIGRRLNYPTALEGALKLKEISYLHAEAYPAGELKHGPLAILEKGVSVIAICPNDDLLEKMESNIEEAKARNASVLMVSEDGDLKVPLCDPLLSPILYIVPLHLLAYYISVAKGIDPDKPRNLAKSVTVE